jgi:hypothetical protein
MGACGAGPVVTLKRRLSMILTGNTPRGLSWAGLGMVGLVALLLPLVPVTAEAAKPEEKPPEKSPAPVPELKKVIARMDSCKSCHSAVKEGWDTPESRKHAAEMTAKALTVRYRILVADKKLSKDEADKLHDMIVKLLADMQKQRADLAVKEKKLHDLLAEFEKRLAPKKTPTQKRIEELELQLRKLQEELKALKGKEGKAKSDELDRAKAERDKAHARAERMLYMEALRRAQREYDAAREREKALDAEIKKLLNDKEGREKLKRWLLDSKKVKPAPKKLPPRKGVAYINRRSFNIPVQWSEANKDAKLAMAYVTMDGGQSWKQIHSIGRGPNSHFSYTATCDGGYGFHVSIDGKEPPGPLTKPSIIVFVDTVPPHAKLSVKHVKDHVYEVTWDVRDANLDRAGGVLEYLAPEGGWKACDVGAALAGRGLRHVEALTLPKRWRLRVKDLAGNAAVVQADVE